MEAELMLVATTIVFAWLVVLLGYLGQKAMGAVLLGLGALIASAFCLVGIWLGYSLGNRVGAWTGLLLGMLLATIVVPWGLSKAIKGRSRKFITGLWLGFCTLSIYGYLAAGWIGLLTITLPSVAMFWFGLFFIATFLLPLRDPSQHSLAFRSLLTFTMGTNYPYYFVDENNKLDKRVDGNPFGHFLSGPGLVYTGCDRAAYISNHVSANRVVEPGLTFTHQFDLEPRIIDLRPQLRAFNVDAQTKDGIPIKVLTFIPFKIDSGNQAVELGQAFPFRDQAAYDALAHELIDHKANKLESGTKQEWDEQLVPVIATPIMQDIIGRYSVDELCPSLESGRDPRAEIITEMRHRVQAALQSYGLEVVGGGIGNPIPQDNEVMKRRIRNWQTKWKNQIQLRMSQGHAYRTRLIDGAWAEIEGKLVEDFTKIVNAGAGNGSNLNTAVILHYINSLKESVRATK